MLKNDEVKLTQKMYDPDDFKEGVNLCDVEISTRDNAVEVPGVKAHFVFPNARLDSKGHICIFKAVAIKKTENFYDPEYDLDPDEIAIRHSIVFIIDVGGRGDFLVIRTENDIYESGKTQQTGYDPHFDCLYHSLNQILMKDKQLFFVITNGGIHIMKGAGKLVGMLDVKDDKIVIRDMFLPLYRSIISPWDLRNFRDLDDFGPLQMYWSYECSLDPQPKNIRICKDVTYANYDILDSILYIYQYFSERIFYSGPMVFPDEAHEIYEQIVKIREKTPPRRRIVGNNP